MSISKKLLFEDYDNFSTEEDYTTSAEAQDYFRNMDEMVTALIDIGLWQPSTKYSEGVVVKSPSMPSGTEAICVAENGGTSSNVEPSWGEVGGGNISDGTCFWKLRWQHWSKSVEEIADLTTGATNRLPNTTYAVGNVVYDRSNLSVALKCTTVGTTSNAELDISNKVVGESVEDGGVVWSVVARIMPAEEINTLANELIKELFVGFVGSYAGNTVPNGWLACDGAAISRTTYADLFAVIGTTYGAGDGSTTFNLPNLNNNSFLEGSNTAGTVKSAGLPNITGDMNGNYGGYIDIRTNPTGAFNVRSNGGTATIESGAHTRNHIMFDASRSNSIYGNSTTVQPKSVTVKYCIKY